jgi:DNA-binding FadR family transcriptional regulator
VPSKSRDPAIRVPKAADLIAAEIRAAIVSGELREGDWLPSEAELVTRFGVSRPTMREAFRVLEAEGLINVRRGPRGGAQVHLPTEDVAARHAALVLQLRGVSLEEVYATRAMVEVPAVGIVARKRTAKQLQQLKALLRREAELEHRDLMHELVTMQEFHVAVVEMAGNETITFLSMMVHEVTRRSVDSWLATHEGGADFVPFHRGHRKLVDLIEARDAEGAERLWRAHLIGPLEFHGVEVRAFRGRQ